MVSETILYRNARLEDLAQIRAINTHYILNTSLTFVQTPPPFELYVEKLNDLAARRLPYIVAVDNAQMEDGNARVLGYASLSPFRSQRSYAPTVELTLFVHPQYQSRAIGSKLLEDLLEKVRNGQVWQLCEETPNLLDSNHLDHTTLKPSSKPSLTQVRNVIAVMAVDPEAKEHGEALKGWYIKRGFEACGRMKKVGFKRGHWIDVVWLQYSVSN